MHDEDLLKSGACAGRNTSVRAGFIPLPLEQVILEGLASMPIFLRTATQNGQEHKFTLYSSANARFTEHQRLRLKEAGIKFVYILIGDHSKFRHQVEAHLEQAMANPALALSAKSELVYETSMELINELLEEQKPGATMPRLGIVAKAVTTLVMNDTSAFPHLFAASQHDFYTATHMVNVGTWMVALAYALGNKDTNALNLICQAGMVHDIGKLFVTEEVLNKKGSLTDDDWRQLRAHPARGVDHLKTFEHVPDLVLRVTAEHHERMDGSGYPAGLKGDQVLLESRICAVVDSFDAMTAFRPFKKKTESVASALRILQADTPLKYDPQVVDAWVKLMQQAQQEGAIPHTPESDQFHGLGRRRFERFTIHCPARVHRMELAGQNWVEYPSVPVTAHSLSRSGLGFLSPHPVTPSQYVRVYLSGRGSLANRAFEGQVVRCRDYADGMHEVGMIYASLDKERKTAEETAAVDQPQPA